MGKIPYILAGILVGFIGFVYGITMGLLAGVVVALLGTIAEDVHAIRRKICCD